MNPGAPDIPNLSCGNIPSAACEEQGHQVVAGLTGILSVDVECDLDVGCTRAGGSGLAEIRFSNGQKVSRPWSYVGDAGPPPVVSCVRLAANLCNSASGSEAEFVSPTKHIVAITVTCTSDRCTDHDGTASVHIVLADGSAKDSSSSWTGP